MKSSRNIGIVFLCSCFLFTSHDVHVVAADQAKKPKGQLLVVGATGTTGLRAIRGFLDVGYSPSQIRLLTRNAKSQKCLELQKIGFEIAEADLEDRESLSGKGITKGCTGCYIHSTSSDRAELDTGEVERAQNLAFVIDNEKNNICHVVYNSAAAQEDHGVARITQKHDVETVFKNLVEKRQIEEQEGSHRDKLSFTSLRCNIFMEELWKAYTRPQILKGRYPLPIRSNRKIYLISVRDLGRLAGSILSATLLQSKDEPAEVNTINIAGDYLSAKAIASAFGAAQGSPCYHYNPRLMAIKAWLYFPELYEQIRFLRTFSVETDVDALRQKFPGLLTSFADFLDETNWKDRERTFEDFADVASLNLYSSA